MGNYYYCFIYFSGGGQNDAGVGADTGWRANSRIVDSMRTHADSIYNTYLRLGFTQVASMYHFNDPNDCNKYYGRVSDFSSGEGKLGTFDSDSVLINGGRVDAFTVNESTMYISEQTVSQDVLNAGNYAYLQGLLVAAAMLHEAIHVTDNIGNSHADEAWVNERVEACSGYGNEFVRATSARGRS